MTKWTKQILRDGLKDEKAVLTELRLAYRHAYEDLTKKIERLIARDRIGAGNVLQLRYQRRIREQIWAILKDLETGTLDTVHKYMERSYINSALGVMYSMQKQHIPLLLPIDRKKIAASFVDRALLAETLSRRIYAHVEQVAVTVQRELTRGIVQGSKYADIARNISARVDVGLRHSYTIARTEGHRVTELAKIDTMAEARDEYGVKVLKRWDAALDDRTRIHHIMLDGQMVPVDQPFRVAGLTAMYPGGFGVPEEDINCRCTMEEIATWEIDADLARTKYDGKSGKIIDVGKISTFSGFKKKYFAEMG